MVTVIKNDAKYIFFKNIGIIVAIIVTTLIQSRAYLKNFYYGDPFDGRLMVVLHEHWWHFLRGRRPFLDTYFFYPYDRGLGFSDTFFLQGFSYSAARALRFDLVDSWALATISILLLSNIGLALLAKQLINNVFLQISFILITGSSFTYFAFLNMYPNVAGYGLVSFLAFFFIKLFSINNSAQDRNIAIIGISISFPLLLLSAWYAAFFSAVYIFLFFSTNALFGKYLKVNFIIKVSYLFKSLNKLVIAVSSGVFSLLIALWIYIYLPVASDVDRDLQELIEGSPKFDQLANGSALGGGLFQKLYEFLGYQNFNQLVQDQNGLTISLFVSWIALGIYFITSKSLTKLELVWAKYVWLISTLQLFIFLQFGNFSIFQIFWQNISPLSAIRVPARMLILFSAVIILLLHVVNDKFVQAKLGLNGSLISTLLVLSLPIIFIDQIRFDNAAWVKKDYFTQDYYQSVVKTKNMCDSFIINSEGEEWWDDQLKAMVLSARLNFPTVNGYSGGYPNNYPAQAWRSKTEMIEVVRWLANENVLTSTCLIRPNAIDKLDQEVLIDSVNGFDLLESSKQDRWWWSLTPSAKFTLINLKQYQIKGELEFTIEVPPCRDALQIEIMDTSTEIVYDHQLLKKRNLISIPVAIDAGSETQIQITTEDEVCESVDEGRTLYFSLKNPTLSPS